MGLFILILFAYIEVNRAKNAIYREHFISQVMMKYKFIQDNAKLKDLLYISKHKTLLPGLSTFK